MIGKLGAAVAVVAVGTLSALGGSWYGREAATAEEKAIPQNSSFYVSGNAPERYVVFAGSWELDGPEKIGFEKQVVQYTCEETDHHCQVAEATVYQNSLSVDSSRVYAEWSPTQITLTSRDINGCREAVTVVDLRTEEVISITNNGAEPQETCKLPRISEPRKSRLVNGFDRYFKQKYPKRDEG